MAEAFELGMPIDLPEVVADGFVNRIWRLSTDRGSWVIKVMGQEWQQPWLLAVLMAAWSVELAAARAGVSMPEPIPYPPTQGPTAEIDVGDDTPWTVRVHRWVDGRKLPDGPAPREVASWAGLTLALLHGLSVDTPNPMQTRPNVDWDELCARAIEADLPWADRLPAVRPALDRLKSFVDSAIPQRTVLTHDDIGAANIILAEPSPYLVDWDVCSEVCTRQHVAYVALGLAGWPPDPAVAAAVIGAYRRAGGTYDDPQLSDLAQRVRRGLGWFTFSVRKALDEGSRRDFWIQHVGWWLDIMHGWPDRLDEQLQVLALASAH